jgi:hypothetical protein
MNEPMEFSTLRSYLRYDSNGGFFWKKNEPLRGIFKGRCPKTAGRSLIILGRYILASRVAWALYHGKWPVGIIKHVDGDEYNNSIENLYETTRPEIAHLIEPKPRPKNVGQRPGVFKIGEKFFAMIYIKNVRYIYGPYATNNAAGLVYGNKKRATRVVLKKERVYANVEGK